MLLLLLLKVRKPLNAYELHFIVEFFFQSAIKDTVETCQHALIFIVTVLTILFLTNKVVISG